MNRVAVVSIAAVGSITLLAGCTPAVPVSGVASPLEVTAALTEGQQARVLEETFAVLAAADKDKSTDEFDVRIGGDAKVVRAAEYKQQSADDGPTPTVLPEDMQAVYVSSAEVWPRVMVGVSEQPSEDLTPVVSVWVQDDVDTPYQMRSWAHMIPGATLPAMPGPTVGADELTTTDDVAGTTAQAVMDDYMKLLKDGKGSDLNDTFAEDSYREQLFTARTALTKTAKTADGKYADTISLTDDDIYVLATAEGGALVFAPVRISSSLTVKDAKVSVSAVDKPLVDGKLVDEVTHEYRDLVVMYIPAEGSEELPTVVAADHHLIRVSPDGEK